MMSKYKQIEQYMQPPYFIEAEEGWQLASGRGRAERRRARRPGEGRAEGAQGFEAARPTPETVEKSSPRELFDYVLNEGRKDYTVQRYKGLGEMSSGQLWETTMDPERRTLLSVKLEDIDRDRNHLHYADGRRCGSAPQVHRRERAGREEPGHLTAIRRLKIDCDVESAYHEAPWNELLVPTPASPR